MIGRYLDALPVEAKARVFAAHRWLVNSQRVAFGSRRSVLGHAEDWQYGGGGMLPWFRPTDDRAVETGNSLPVMHDSPRYSRRTNNFLTPPREAIVWHYHALIGRVGLRTAVRLIRTRARKRLDLEAVRRVRALDNDAYRPEYKRRPRSTAGALRYLHENFAEPVITSDAGVVLEGSELTSRDLFNMDDPPCAALSTHGDSLLKAEVVARFYWCNGAPICWDVSFLSAVAPDGRLYLARQPDDDATVVIAAIEPGEAADELLPLYFEQLLIEERDDPRWLPRRPDGGWVEGMDGDLVSSLLPDDFDEEI